ncbi:MAG: hypothetical protein DRQ43_10010 [Gammaproteobacteria bacterium]|nr:MAG: hypothetical protein DRQ43_10010 [Gammaproteobacteria bacterium]
MSKEETLILRDDMRLVLGIKLASYEAEYDPGMEEEGAPSTIDVMELSWCTVEEVDSPDEVVHTTRFALPEGWLMPFTLETARLVMNRQGGEG